MSSLQNISKLMKSFLIFSLTASIASSNAFALDELSLKEAVIAALSSDERIAAARSGLRAAEENRSGAKSYYKPQISGVGSFSFNDINEFNTFGSLQRDGKRISGGIELKQNLLTFGRNKARVERSDAEIGIAQYELFQTRDAVILETIDAYLGTQTAIKIVQTYQDHVENLKDLQISSKAKFDLSLVSATEYALVTSRYQQALAQLASAEATLAQRQDALGQLIHDSFSTLSPNQTDLHIILPKNKDQAMDIALDNAPDYLMAKYEMDIANADLKASKAERYPTLSATAKWVRGKVGDRPTGEKEVGFAMTMPLYDGGLTSSRIRRAKHQLGQARYTQESAKRKAEQSVRSAYVMLNSTRNVAESWNTALQAEEKSLRGVEKEVETNLEGMPYLLEAKDKMVSVRIRSLETSKDAKMAEFELLAIVGIVTDVFTPQPITSE